MYPVVGTVAKQWLWAVPFAAALCGEIQGCTVATSGHSFMWRLLPCSGSGHQNGKPAGPDALDALC